MADDSNWRAASSDDPRDRVSGLLDRIPGYRGYRDKEGRRDADRLVREEVAAAFGRQADRVEIVGRDLANRRRIQDIGTVDAFAKAIRHVADRIRTASYGYAPLFSDRQIDERALDQLRRFDESLLQSVDELDAPITALEAALESGGDLEQPARVGGSAIRAIGQRLDLRTQVMTTGEPASEEGVLAVLNPKPPATPHPAFNLNQGDAVSILGDNFVVDARIAVDAGEQSFRLFRINAGPPQRWLLAPSDPSLGFADLQPAPTNTTDPSSAASGVTFRDVAAGQGNGEISGSEGATGRRSVTFRLLAGVEDADRRSVVLDWGNEQQIFVGHSVHPNDIEIFGRAQEGN